MYKRQWLYRTDAKFVNINPSEFQAYKMDATPVVADANEALTALSEELKKIGYHKMCIRDRYGTGNWCGAD